MQQKLLFLFGEFDNQLRKQKCTAGIKDMLLAGDWPTKPPLGFDAIKEGRVRKIVINAKGRLLKKAFEWKAFENLSNETIRERLSLVGLKLNHQRISELFRNPFYCGLMVHKMLEGKVVEGNQQRMVSREVFLKVNGLLDQNSHGYTMNEENVQIPLKRFVKCGHCGQPLRGYIVKKKNTYYYKCNTKACGNNKNAEVLNNRFANILEVFKVSHAKDFLTLLKKQVVATFNQLSSGKQEDLEVLQKLHREIIGKVSRLEQRYIEEEIGGELYRKYKVKYDEERDSIEQNLMKLTSQVSNLENCVDLAIKFATELPLKWHSGDYHTKQQLQHLLIY